MANVYAAHVNSVHAGSRPIVVAWVQGVLKIDTQIKEPRLAFVANREDLLPKGPRIRTPGRIEGIISRAKPGEAIHNQNYKPYPGRSVLLISTTPEREGLEPHWWVFSVEDPEAVCAAIKAHREAQS